MGIFALYIALIKVIYYWQLSTSRTILTDVFIGALPSIAFISAISVLIISARVDPASRTKKIVLFATRLLLNFILFSYIVLFTIDTTSVIFFNERIFLNDLPEIGKNLELVPLFMKAPNVALFSVFSILLFIFSARYLNRIYLNLGIALLTSLFYVSQKSQAPFDHRSVSHLSLVLEHFLPAETEASYPKLELLRYAAQYEKRFEEIALDGNPHILLYVVESLSLHHFNHFSTHESMVPLTESLMKEGLFFDNYFSNKEQSDGGMIALLSGTIPFRFHGSSSNIYENVSFPSPILDSYRKRGYQSLLLTTGPMKFKDRFQYYDNIGFDEVIGRDRLSSLKNAPRFAFDSPSDEVLVELIMEQLKKKLRSNTPLFLTGITVTSHLPYLCPDGPPHSEQAVWSFVDRQIYSLYNKLKEIGFFDNGILIISSDHHEMQPPRPAIIQKYGKSSFYRIPLLILGKDVPKNSLQSGYLQQADLLAALRPTLQNQHYSASPIIFNIIYGHNEHRASRRIRMHSVYDTKSWLLDLNGTQIVWPEGAPPYKTEAENILHTHRGWLEYKNMNAH